jgi:hypothetical protein
VLLSIIGISSAVALITGSCDGVSVGVIVGMVVLVGLGDGVSVGYGVTVGVDVKVGAARKLFSFSKDEHALITNSIPDNIPSNRTLFIFQFLKIFTVFTPMLLRTQFG